ncbi:hypothetical protein A2529_05005 [Candidatus Peribacteria bacterium RIFOXYD2_FULL_58_15]|nr:MAG: hypothetical protein A2529_05005 [Candidatus Peribacteria bacterium RIFOXYD2_FULL_58_15]
MEGLYVDEGGMTAIDDLILVTQLSDIKGIREDELQGGNAEGQAPLLCKFGTFQQFLLRPAGAARLRHEPLSQRPTPNLTQGILTRGVALKDALHDRRALWIEDLAIRTIIEITERCRVGATLVLP